MPVRIEYTNDNIGIILHNEGFVTGKEILAAQAEVYNDSRFPNLNYWICDLSKSEEFSPSFEETKQIAENEIEASHRNPGLLIAIIAGSDHTYAMSNIFKAFAHKSKSDINVFLNRELADEWILSKLSNHN